MGLFDFLSKKKKTDYKLFYDTEVHCHILPGIDDGSPDVATSVELVRQMSDMGIRRIITTSHVTESTFENTPETIRKAYTELRSARTRLPYLAPQGCCDTFLRTPFATSHH